MKPGTGRAAMVVAGAAAAAIALRLAAQGTGGGPPEFSAGSATVEVLAYSEDDGHRLAPRIALFESEDHKDRSSLFRSGVGAGVPYGIYRLRVALPAYVPDGALVSVYQPRVTVVVGMAVGYELPQSPLTLTGRVVGPQPKNGFVKLVGIYNGRSMESSIGADGSFRFVGLTHGRFLLLVVDETGILATRAVAVPPGVQPVEIRIGTAAAAPIPFR